MVWFLVFLLTGRVRELVASLQKWKYSRNPNPVSSKSHGRILPWRKYPCGILLRYVGNGASSDWPNGMMPLVLCFSLWCFRGRFPILLPRREGADRNASYFLFRRLTSLRRYLMLSSAAAMADLGSGILLIQLSIGSFPVAATSRQ